MKAIRKAQAWTDSRRRRRTGNVMVLVAAITMGIIIAVVLFALDYNQFLGASHQHLTAVESAGLAAAQDLSRIVIRDQNFGYISLTDYPPVGRATVAKDGRPMPVTGVNTLIGTARLDMLIANHIGNADMIALATKDSDDVKAAARLLTECLKKALEQQEGGPSGEATIAGDKEQDPKAGPWTDMDGNIINPYADAKRVYMSNLTSMSNGGKPVVASFKCDLGFLQSGGSTLTPVPKPTEMAQVDSNQRHGDNYKAFVNIPAGGKDFYFAGLSAQPALIDARQFREDDGLRICSAVRVQAEHSFERAESTTTQIFKTIACAEPSGTPDSTPPGVMTLGFPDGFVPGITKMRDLLSHADLSSSIAQVAESSGGDFPLDGTLIPTTIITGAGDTGSPTTAGLFAHAYYSFIKNGRTRVNIKRANDVLDLPLSGMSMASAVLPETQPWKFEVMQPAYAKKKPKGAPASSPEFGDGIHTGAMKVVQTATERWNALLAGTAAGKSAYDAISSWGQITTMLPENAAKLVVDDSGTMYSSSGEPVSKADLQAFWAAVQNTNTAAFQTLATARQAKLLALVPNSSIDNAITNAENVIEVSSALLKEQHAYTEDGLSKNGDGTFQVAGAVFNPHPIPATDAAALTAGTAPSGDPATPNMDWTADPKNFECFDHDKSVASNSPKGKNPWRVIMLEFDAQGDVTTSLQDTLPFFNLPISENQILAVAYNAMRTPGDVVWTAVARNYVARPGKGKHGGTPLPGTPVNWCELTTFGGDINRAFAMARGQMALGLSVTGSGAGGAFMPPPPGGASTLPGGLLNGTGPRSAEKGNGDIDHDKRGFPWGFKLGTARPGQDWSTNDVKYQFPGGATELPFIKKGVEVNNGKKFGSLKKALNEGRVNLPVQPPGPIQPAYGANATFGVLGGGALPVQPRANYYCGGLSVDFQMRAPIIDLSLVAGTSNGLSLVQPGTGTALVGGISVPLPELAGTDVRNGVTDKGVLGKGDAGLTHYLPPAGPGIN